MPVDDRAALRAQAFAGLDEAVPCIRFDEALLGVLDDDDDSGSGGGGGSDGSLSEPAGCTIGTITGISHSGLHGAPSGGAGAGPGAARAAATASGRGYYANASGSASASAYAYAHSEGGDTTATGMSTVTALSFLQEEEDTESSQRDSRVLDRICAKYMRLGKSATR